MVRAIPPRRPFLGRAVTGIRHRVVRQDGRMILLEEALGSATAKNGVYPVICIDGRGASGKTSLAEFLVSRLPGFTLVHGDDYFEPYDDPITWGDFNEARFDTDVLHQVRLGNRQIPLRPFDFPNGRIGDEQMLTVAQGLVVERWFGFSLDIPRDVSIWVETPASVCLARGLGRDGDVALGDRARLAWESVWQPREDRYIEAVVPTESADFVVDGTRPFEAQFQFTED